MSALAERKTKLVFETAETVRECGRSRSVIIEAQPYIALVRLKGTRKAFPISYGAIYHAAARLAAVEARSAKKRGSK